VRQLEREMMVIGSHRLRADKKTRHSGRASVYA